MDVAAQRYSSLEDSQRGFYDSWFSLQLAWQCRGNTLLLSLPALPSKHLTLPRVSAKKHPTVWWICINKQLLCSELPSALHPPGRQQTLGVKSSFACCPQPQCPQNSFPNIHFHPEKSFLKIIIFHTACICLDLAERMTRACDPENHSSHPQALLSCSRPCFSLAEKDGTWFQK